MNLDSYPVISSEDLLTHTFISEGPKGQILKRIEFQCCDQNQFNLAFGNWKNANQTLDDLARSNNNDRDKILATVAKAIMLFLDAFPDTRIEVRGSTSSRTRLYQIKVVQHLLRIRENYVVQGLKDNEWKNFDRNENYSALSLITRTKVK